MRNTAALQFFLIATFLVQVADATEFKHLGCYADKAIPSLRDINGQDSTYGTLKLDTCLEECRKKGYPYAGLQQGIKCFCGDTYGQWGGKIVAPQSYSACNWTCDGNIQCGGILHNNVYYTVRVDGDYSSKLVVVYHDDPKLYVEARRQCIRNGGDLMTMNTLAQIQNATRTAKNAGKSTGNIWFGLRNRWWNSSLLYEWTNATMPPFKIDDYQAFVRDNAILDPCMTLLPQYDQWKSDKCDQAYPYICLQLSPDVLETTPAPTYGTVEDETSDTANLLSLYIVLPLFALCYGGSCMLYCTYKLYRSFKRKKHAQMLLSNMVTMPTEYEPNTKPTKQPPVRPLSSGKAKVYPAPQPYMPQPMRGPGPPPNPRQPLRGPAPRPPPIRPVPTPISAGNPMPESRPTTSGAIELNLDGTGNTPRPDSSVEGRPKTRAELKRDKLLDNAAKEARERRAQRQGSAGPPPYAPGSSMGKDRGESRVSKKGPMSNRDEPADSGDSSTNLLRESGGGTPPSITGSRMSQDPTQLSIQEILKMKVAAKAK